MGECGYIFDAAGYDKLTNTCNEIEHRGIGSAVLNPAFNLDAKHIIHAVCPQYMGELVLEVEDLYSA